MRLGVLSGVPLGYTGTLDTAQQESLFELFSKCNKLKLEMFRFKNWAGETSTQVIESYANLHGTSLSHRPYMYL